MEKNQLILEASEDDRWLVTDFSEKDASALSEKFSLNKDYSWVSILSIQSTPFIENFGILDIKRD